MRWIIPNRVLLLAAVAIACSSTVGCDNRDRLLQDALQRLPSKVMYFEEYRKVVLIIGEREFKDKIPMPNDMLIKDGLEKKDDGFKVTTFVIDKSGEVFAPVIAIKKQRLGAVRPFLEASWDVPQSFVGDGGNWVHVPLHDKVDGYLLLIRHIDANHEESECRTYIAKSSDVPAEEMGKLRIPRFEDLPLLSDRVDQVELGKSWAAADEFATELRASKDR